MTKRLEFHKNVVFATEIILAIVPYAKVNAL